MPDDKGSDWLGELADIITLTNMKPQTILKN
jgi:hypothetical protein